MLRPWREDGGDTLPAQGHCRTGVCPSRPAAGGEQAEVTVSFSNDRFSAERFVLSLTAAAEGLPGWVVATLPLLLLSEGFQEHPRLGKAAAQGSAGPARGQLPPGQVLAQFPAPVPQTPSARASPACLTVPLSPRPLPAPSPGGGWGSVFQRCWAHAAPPECPSVLP